MQHWTLTICASCILVGILQLILPPKSSGKSIKTVLTLYILLSVVGFGTQKDKVPSFSFETGRMPVDYSEYVNQVADMACKKQLERALAQKGIQGRVEICEGTVRCVSDSPIQAEQILRQLIDSNTELEIISLEE